MANRLSESARESGFGARPTLDKFKVPQKEKDEVLAAASGLKKDIVER